MSDLTYMYTRCDLSAKETSNCMQCICEMTWGSCIYMHIHVCFTMCVFCIQISIYIHSIYWTIVMPHIRVSHVTPTNQKSYKYNHNIQKRVTSICNVQSMYIHTKSYECMHVGDVTHKNESCLTYEWAMSHTGYEWVMSHLRIKHNLIHSTATTWKGSSHTNEWVMSHIWMSHVAYTIS